MKWFSVTLVGSTELGRGQVVDAALLIALSTATACDREVRTFDASGKLPLLR